MNFIDSFLIGAGAVATILMILCAVAWITDHFKD